MTFILTPAALEAAAKAMFETQQDEDEREYGSRDTWDQIHDSAKGYYLKYATIAFNAAIAKLIEGGRAEVCQDFVWGDDGEDHKFGLGEGENGEDDMPTVIVIKGEP